MDRLLLIRIWKKSLKLLDPSSYHAAERKKGRACQISSQYYYVLYHAHTLWQYQSNALVIRYNRAVLEPSGDFQVDDGSDDSESPAGFPTWGIVIIVVGALVLVAALSVVIMVILLLCTCTKLILL